MNRITTIATAILSSVFSGCSSETQPASPDAPDNSPRVLTVYYSSTGTTKAIADKIHSAAGGDILRIEPAEPYTAADLDYNTDCRANREQNDPAARPAIKTALPDMADYDIVFLGYPIWWGSAPKIIYTLLESADFAGKTVIPFCTSGSSPVVDSEPGLHALVPDAVWKAGKRFPANASSSDIARWVADVTAN